MQQTRTDRNLIGASLLAKVSETVESECIVT